LASCKSNGKVLNVKAHPVHACFVFEKITVYNGYNPEVRINTYSMFIIFFAIIYSILIISINNYLFSLQGTFLFII